MLNQNRLSNEDSVVDGIGITTSCYSLGILPSSVPRSLYLHRSQQVGWLLDLPQYSAVACHGCAYSRLGRNMLQEVQHRVLRQCCQIKQQKETQKKCKSTKIECQTPRHILPNVLCDGKLGRPLISNTWIAERRLTSAPNKIPSGTENIFATTILSSQLPSTPDNRQIH